MDGFDNELRLCFNQVLDVDVVAVILVLFSTVNILGEIDGQNTLYVVEIGYWVNVV